MEKKEDDSGGSKDEKFVSRFVESEFVAIFAQFLSFELDLFIGHSRKHLRSLSMNLKSS